MNHRQLFCLLSFVLLLTISCGETDLEVSEAPTEVSVVITATSTPSPEFETPVPTPTNTETAVPVPSITATSTHTPTLTTIPTETPTPTSTTAIWVAAETPLPSSNPIIDSQNVTQITELARWGKGVIQDIDLSADGQWVAVASGSGVYIHDVHDLSAEPRAIETTGNVTAVSISPLGDRVALITWTGELQLWQVEPLELVFVGEETMDVQFSPDGNVLAVTKIKPSTGNPSHIELWDSSNGTILDFYGRAMHNPRITFSPNSSLIAIWSETGDEVFVHDWAKDELIFKEQVNIHPEKEGEYQAITGDVTFLTEDDLRLLVLEGEAFIRFSGRIELQDVNKEQPLFSLGSMGLLSEPIKYVCNEPIIFWDPPEPMVPYHMEVNNDTNIVGLMYEDRGYGGDYTHYSMVRFHRASDGQFLYLAKEGIVDFEMSPDGQTWVAGLQDGRLQLRRASDGTVLDSVDGYESPILDITISTDSEQVGVSYVDEVKIYRREDGEMLYRYPASSIAFAPDQATFALAYEDGRIEVRDLTDGNVINSTAAHGDRVTTISYLPSGELISAGFDCRIIRWLMPEMIELGSFENVTVWGYDAGEQVPVRVRDFLVIPDGESVIGLLYGDNFGVWSVSDGHVLRTPNVHRVSTIIAVSPVNDFLAIPSDRMFESWDETTSLIGTDALVAAFSPDAKLLAGEQWQYRQDHNLDGALTVWEVPSMDALHIATPQTDNMMGIGFTADGRLLITAALDGVVRLWGVP